MEKDEILKNITVDKFPWIYHKPTSETTNNVLALLFLKGDGTFAQKQISGSGSKYAINQFRHAFLVQERYGGEVLANGLSRKFAA